MEKNLNTKEMHNYYISHNISIKETGKRFGISAGGLIKRFRKAGLPTKARNQTRERKISLDLLKHLYQKNYSIDELAKRFKCSRGTVWNRLCDMGINKTPEEAKAARSDSYTLWTQEFTEQVKKNVKRN